MIKTINFSFSNIFSNIIVWCIKYFMFVKFKKKSDLIRSDVDNIS